jgi:hypothetical protein
MQTKQIVQASANVVRITNVSAGDVYKRFEQSSYSDSTYFGIVRNVHNDGENTVIECTEFRKSYSDLEMNYKVFTNKTEDLAMFPATPEELNMELSGIIENKEKQIQKKEKEIKKLVSEIGDLQKIESGEMMKGLKQMSYKELSQHDYEQKKLAVSQL